jgi:hypothetical protein
MPNDICEICQWDYDENCRCGCDTLPDDPDYEEFDDEVEYDEDFDEFSRWA